MNEKSKAFLDEIAEVCKKHGLTLAHEDSQGSFIVEPYDPETIKWMFQACRDARVDRRICGPDGTAFEPTTHE